MPKRPWNQYCENQLNRLIITRMQHLLIIIDLLRFLDCIKPFKIDRTILIKDQSYALLIDPIIHDGLTLM